MIRRWLIWLLCRSIERHPKHGLTIYREAGDDYWAYFVPYDKDAS